MFKNFLIKIIKLMPSKFIEIIWNEKTKNHDYQIIEYWQDKFTSYQSWSPPSIPSISDIEHYEHVIKELQPFRTLVLGSTPALRDLAAKHSQEHIVADISLGAIIGFLQLTKYVNPTKEIWLKANWLKLPLPDRYFDCIVGDMVLSQIEWKDYQLFLREMNRLLRKNGRIITRCTYYDKKYINKDSQLIIEDTLEKFKNQPKLGKELLLRRLQGKFIDSNKKINNIKIINALRRHGVICHNKSHQGIENIINLTTPSWTRLTKEELFSLLKEQFFIDGIHIGNEHEDAEMFPIFVLRSYKRG